MNLTDLPMIQSSKLLSRLLLSPQPRGNAMLASLSFVTHFFLFHPLAFFPLSFYFSPLIYFPLTIANITRVYALRTRKHADTVINDSPKYAKNNGQEIFRDSPDFPSVLTRRVRNKATRV